MKNQTGYDKMGRREYVLVSIKQTYKLLHQAIRASTMETPIFGYLNGSHTYTSLFYHFLIVVPNKHLIPPTQISHKVLKWDPLINYQ